MGSYSITNFGCKVNRYDGQLLVEEFHRSGWSRAGSVEEADCLIVNCCMVTARSVGRCRRSVRSLARRNGKAAILVTGCLTPADREIMQSIDPRIETAGEDHGRQLARDFLAASPLSYGEFDCEDLPGGVSGLEGRTRAFLKVQDGCDLGCTYCIIPSIGGGSTSRRTGEIIDEAARLLDAGHREIVICGIRLGGFRDGELRLDSLLARLLQHESGPYRIRLSSLNPAEVTPALLDVMAADRRVARHLHLPLQSGDDDTLRRMKRPYTVSSFMKTLERIRDRLREPAISTDFIVGFPGEDDEAFERSLAVLHESAPSRVHVFPFSSRDGTVAAGLPGWVADSVKTERAAEARRAAAGLKERYDRTFLGREARVLIETGGEAPAGLTSRYQKAVLHGPDCAAPGSFARVVLEHYDNDSFTARRTGACS